MIFAFYSYKGGVGRSLPLAHVGYVFAECVLRVLAVDFDLEAPGLERYCRESDEVQSMHSRSGLIDLITTFRKAPTSRVEFDAAALRDRRQFVRSVKDPVNSKGGRLDLMPAGRRGSAEQLREYSHPVRSFDWQDFFDNWKGDRFSKWLREEWSDPEIGYDVILVDSRTGVTEMGGVCAYRLADAAVLLCAPNFQNLESSSLIAAFRDLKARVPAASMWDSVDSEARFTLEPYLGIAGVAEQRAAKALLDALAGMASA